MSVQAFRYYLILLVPTVKPRLSDKAEGESRRSYAHKWGSDEEEETNSRASSSSNGSEMDSSSSLGHSRQVQRTTTTVKTDIRLVRQAKQCLDMGELKDFQNDLDYFMETLGSREASINLKCLRWGSRITHFLTVVLAWSNWRREALHLNFGSICAQNPLFSRSCCCFWKIVMRTR